MFINNYLLKVVTSQVLTYSYVIVIILELIYISSRLKLTYFLDEPNSKKLKLR